MQDKVIIITGSSDGIGAAAARLLKAKGANVVIIGRSVDRTKEIANELDAPYYIADFAILDEVRGLAARLKKDFTRIDILVNNAGGIMADRELTIDGYEKTFQVNHLAPFLLTNLLLDRLVESNAIIINTASVANKLFGHIDINDLGNEKNYSSNKAYGDSKLANILFTKELQVRYGKLGISAVAFHPGNVATHFATGSTSLLRILYQTPLRRLLLTPEKGADTLVWLASTHPGTDWEAGEYYEKRKISKANEQAYDADLAKELWDLSLTMIDNDKQ